MTLNELSKTYRHSAALLKERMEALTGQMKDAEDDQARLRLEERVRVLSAMWRETRDVAVFLERYYERGYHRNGKYTV